MPTGLHPTSRRSSRVARAIAIVRRVPATLDPVVILRALLIATLLLLAAAAIDLAGAQTAAPPANLRDLDAWIEYKSHARIGALPAEARIFYRQGRIAWRGNQQSEALRLVRGAAALDPTFAAPHLALASWYTVRQPALALESMAKLVGLLRVDFRLQLDVVANVVFYLFHVAFLALLGAALLLVAARQHELRHLWREQLRAVLLPATAAVWAWALLVTPFLVGFGLALPAIAMLGLSWPMLRGRERALFIALVVAVAAVPLCAGVMDRLSRPLRENAAPYYGVVALEHEPWDAGREAALARLATEQPGNGFVQFGLAWIAQRGGDLATAETAYRKALEIWPTDDRALNNLGNLLSTQGRFDEALELYQRASAAGPNNAAPHYNASQVHTRRFDYNAASEAVAKASALDFDLVRTYQGMTARDGALPLIDQWLAPGRFWQALMPGPLPSFDPATLPPAWRGAIEARGWAVSVAALMIGAAAVVLGTWLHRRLPLRPCSNCGTTVCRRCSRRRRETALCPACGVAAAGAESEDFERVLLGQVRRRIERQRRIVRTTLATLIPGFGMVTLRQVFAPLALLVVVAVVVTGVQGLAPPFALHPRLADPGVAAPAELLFGLTVFIWALSILGYLGAAKRAAAVAAPPPPARSRLADDDTPARVA